MFSAIGYKLDNFFNLRDQYDGSQLKTNRKSELKLKLNKVDESLRQVKCDAASVCNISKDIANLQGSAIQISQSYLKKAEFMQNLLVSLGKLEFKKLLVHVDRHANEIVFVRCMDRSCCSEWRCNRLRDHLSLFDFKLPAPVLGTFFEGHNDTFLQRLEKRGEG